MFPDPPCNLTAGDRQAQEKNLLWGFEMRTIPAAPVGTHSWSCPPPGRTCSRSSHKSWLYGQPSSGQLIEQNLFLSTHQICKRLIFKNFREEEQVEHPDLLPTSQAQFLTAEGSLIRHLGPAHLKHHRVEQSC